MTRALWSMPYALCLATYTLHTLRHGLCLTDLCLTGAYLMTYVLWQSEARIDGIEVLRRIAELSDPADDVPPNSTLS